MDIDDKDLTEASNDSSSGPEEINNKDAKDVAVTSIKAEFASQRLLKEKAKKLRLQIELRNVEQKKTKAKKKAENDSSPPKLVKSDIDDKANVSLAVEKTKSVKPKKSMKAKKIIKSSINLENSNNKRDSSTGNSQAEPKRDSNDKDEPKKLTGNARKKARKRFTKASISGKVFNNKLVKNSVIKTEKNTQNFHKMKIKTKNSKTDVVKDNNSTEKAHGKKRKLKETNKNMPKIKSMKKATVKAEKTN